MKHGAPGGPAAFHMCLNRDRVPVMKRGAPGEHVLAMRVWPFAPRRTAKFQSEALPVGSIGMDSPPASRAGGVSANGAVRVLHARGGVGGQQPRRLEREPVVSHRPFRRGPSSSSTSGSVPDRSPHPRSPPPPPPDSPHSPERGAGRGCGARIPVPLLPKNRESSTTIPPKVLRKTRNGHYVREDDALISSTLRDDALSRSWSSWT